MATQKEIKKHYEAVARLGCVACHKLGYFDTPAEIHHIKDQFRLGKKASYLDTIPLCPYHHRTSNEAYHYSPKTFTNNFGSQQELLQYTKELLLWQKK